MLNVQGIIRLFKGELMFNKKKILCACCAVCVAVQAQNASVSGRVQSSETKEPLQSVNIVIPNLELGSTTDIFPEVSTTEETTNFISSWGSTTTINYISCDQAFIGDGYCDDTNNNVECNYDGNDCCLPAIVDDFCSVCICHEDGTKHPSLNGGITFISPTSTNSFSEGVV